MALTRVRSNMVEYVSSTVASSSGVINLDFGNHDTIVVTLTENATLANPTGLRAGQRGKIIINQHATAAKTLAFGSYWIWSGSTTPAVSSTLGSINVLEYFVIDSTHIHIVMNQTSATAGTSGGSGGSGGTGGTGGTGTQGNTNTAEWLMTLANSDRILDSVMDSSDNVYAVGVSANIDPNGWNAYVSKISSAGIVQWQYEISTGVLNTLDMASKITLDSTGNIYLLSSIDALNSNVSGTSLKGPTVIKLDSSGSLVWKKCLNTTPTVTGWEDRPADIKYYNGNIYVVGYFSISYKPVGYLIKLDLSGNIVWQKKSTYTGTGNCGLSYRNIRFDSSGNIFVLGDWSGDGYTMGMIIFKFDSTGTIIWKNYINNFWFGSSSDNNGFGIDSVGNMYFVGVKNGVSPTSYCLIKLNSAGVKVWEKVISQPYNTSGTGNNGVSAQGVYIDSSDNIYIMNDYNNNSGAINTAALIKFDVTGAIVWQKTLSSTNGIMSRGFFLNSDNLICYFGAKKRTGVNTWDGLVGKFNNQGPAIGTFDGIVIANSTSTVSDTTTLSVIQFPITAFTDGVSTFSWTDFTNVTKVTATLATTLTTVSSGTSGTSGGTGGTGGTTVQIAGFPITKAMIYPSNNQGFNGQYGGTTPSTSLTYVTLQGSQDNTTWVDIGSSNDNSSRGTTITVNSNNVFTVWKYVRVNIAGSPIYLSEVQFFTTNNTLIPGSTGTAIGDLTAGAGLASGFDGNTSQAAGSGPQLTAGGAGSARIGKDYSASTTTVTIEPRPYVLTSNSGDILTSSDNGASWTLRNSGTTGVIHNVQYLNNKFYAGGGTTGLMTSSDGVAWSAVPISGNIAAFTGQICYGNGKLVANVSLTTHSGWTDTAISTDGGTTWTSNNVGNIFSNSVGAMVSDGTNYYVGGNDTGGGYGSWVMKSTDGLTWANFGSASFGTLASQLNPSTNRTVNSMWVVPSNSTLPNPLGVKIWVGLTGSEVVGYITSTGTGVVAATYPITSDSKSTNGFSASSTSILAYTDNIGYCMQTSNNQTWTNIGWGTTYGNYITTPAVVLWTGDRWIFAGPNPSGGTMTITSTTDFRYWYDVTPSSIVNSTHTFRDGI